MGCTLILNVTVGRRPLISNITVGRRLMIMLVSSKFPSQVSRATVRRSPTVRPTLLPNVTVGRRLLIPNVMVGRRTMMGCPTDPNVTVGRCPLISNVMVGRRLMIELGSSRVPNRASRAIMQPTSLGGTQRDQVIEN
jgi:hypothetical protein